MTNLLKSFKTEIYPTLEQKIKINQTIGTCRYVYNFYLAHNKERYEKGEKFMSGKSFSVWLNNEYIPGHPECQWIKEVSSKSVKKSIENACTAFARFFKHQSSFPRFKKKEKSDVKMGYLIRSGTVSVRVGRYYVSVLIDVPDIPISRSHNRGIGIDLGLKEFAVVSDGTTYKNINKTKKIKQLEKQLRREQRCLSRKYENLKKGESAQRNIQKQKLKVQKLHHRMDNIRTDYINKTIAEIVKTKPSYITIEDLNVAGMMKNRHLAKATASQKFYEFRTKLKAKCDDYGIELRVVDRWYPSSKQCHCCGSIRKDLKLSDRMYICTCGYREDRDFNASLNLRDAVTYKVA